MAKIAFGELNYTRKSTAQFKLTMQLLIQPGNKTRYALLLQFFIRFAAVYPMQIGWLHYH
jgi:hypothetical protein